MATEKILEIYRKLDPIARADVLSHAAFALRIQEGGKKGCRSETARTQEALKEDHGLVGLDACQLNSAGEKPAA